MPRIVLASTSVRPRLLMIRGRSAAGLMRLPEIHSRHHRHNSRKLGGTHENVTLGADFPYVCGLHSIRLVSGPFYLC